MRKRILTALLIAALAGSASAQINVGGSPIGTFLVGMSQATGDLRYCKLSGCTMTGAITGAGANVFAAATTTTTPLSVKSTDNNTTKSSFSVLNSAGTEIASWDATGHLRTGACSSTTAPSSIAAFSNSAYGICIDVGNTGIYFNTNGVAQLTVSNNGGSYVGGNTNESAFMQIGTSVGLNRPAAGIMGLVGANGTGTGDLKLTASVLTAGTMSLSTSALSRTAVSVCSWTNANITALGAVTAGDISCATLPAKMNVDDVKVVIDTPDTSTNALTVACGVTGASYIDYVVASDAKAAANTVYGDATAERGTNMVIVGGHLPSYTGTTTLNCHFIKTTTNLNTVTGSTGHVIITHRLLP